MDLLRAQRRRAALCAVLWVAALGLVGPASAACGRAVGTVQPVAIDERLDVTLEDGRIVRLAGLDPASVHGSRALARAADDSLTGVLIGQPSTLLLLANGTDRWGRTVADLVPAAGGSAAEALLAAGFVRVRPEFETRACAASRLAIEDEARRAGRGIWADPAFAAIDASDRTRLRQHDGQFVLVEGKVRRVGFGRSRLYLDLGPRGGTTLVVNRKLEPVLARSGAGVDALQGRIVRARGALDMRFGPRIELVEPAMLEIVQAAAPAGAGRDDATGDETRRP